MGHFKCQWVHKDSEYHTFKKITYLHNFINSCLTVSKFGQKLSY